MRYHRNCHKTPANSSLSLYDLCILLIDNVIGRHCPQHSHGQACRSRFHLNDMFHNVRMGCRNFAFEDVPTHTQCCTTKRCDLQLPCVILPLTPSVADAFLRFIMSRGRCRFMVVERIHVSQPYPPSCLSKDLERNRCLESVSIFSTQKPIYEVPPLSSAVRRLPSILRTF